MSCVKRLVCRAMKTGSAGSNRKEMLCSWVAVIEDGENETEDGMLGWVSSHPLWHAQILVFAMEESC